MSPLAKLPEAFQNLMRPHVRRAFRPQVEPGDASGPVSKIGGAPWLPKGTEWPTCPNCKHPMQLLLQLHLAELPEGAPGRGPGLAQLFYCLNGEPLCEVDCEAFVPRAKSVVTRLVSTVKDGGDAAPRKVPNPIKPKRIVGWQPEEDLPNSEEATGPLGMDDDDALFEALNEAQLPLSGDKLGGWPYWVQGLEYPDCPECKKPMRLLFQIDSECHVEHMWGDSGCAHLTQCETHRHQLAFGWACC